MGELPDLQNGQDIEAQEAVIEDQVYKKVVVVQVKRF
jgi:hypothetical protein